jgi:hypothetical protein
MKVWTRFDLWVQHYFDAWVEAKVRDSVSFLLPSNSDLMCEFIRRMDIQPLSALVAANRDLQRAVAEQVQDGVDTDEIAERVSSRIDASDVAYHIDASDVASNMDIDTCEIASRIADDLDMSSLAEELDYDKLAEAVVGKLKEAWTH